MKDYINNVEWDLMNELDVKESWEFLRAFPFISLILLTTAGV